MLTNMIKNFLIISCIGKDDKLGLRINKDFFVHIFKNKTKNKNLVSEISNFLNSHKIHLDENFSIIVNQGPGSFSGIRIALAVAKVLEISRNIKLYGYNNEDLKFFDLKNMEKLFNEKIIEKKLIKPIYLS